MRYLIAGLLLAIALCASTAFACDVTMGFSISNSTTGKDFEQSRTLHSYDGTALAKTLDRAVTVNNLAVANENKGGPYSLSLAIKFSDPSCGVPAVPDQTYAGLTSSGLSKVVHQMRKEDDALVAMLDAAKADKHPWKVAKK